jgi:hypothetical protein
VNLLVEQTKVAKVDEEPLAIRMAALATATPEERVRSLKEIGDTSLYVSGFFGESLARRLIDVDYYVTMGGAAYGQLARLGARGSELFRETYDELSRKFAQFVRVLHEIKKHMNFAGGAASSNLIRLYEEWVRTGSEWLEERLRETGVLAIETFSPNKLTH